MMAMQQPEQEAAEMMMEESESSVTVSLACDVNDPNDGDEVTVQVYTDAPLWIFIMDVSVVGDVNITSADCNLPDLDTSLPCPPYIDESTGFVEIAGVMQSEEGFGPGNIGYIKFIYHSGQVSLSITLGDGLDAYCMYTNFSTEPLLIGRDPNE